MEDMMRCPFCGGLPMQNEYVSGDGYVHVYVECSVCGARSKVFVDDKDGSYEWCIKRAMDAWNLRK